MAPQKKALTKSMSESVIGYNQCGQLEPIVLFNFEFSVYVSSPVSKVRGYYGHVVRFYLICGKCF